MLKVRKSHIYEFVASSISSKKTQKKSKASRMGQIKSKGIFLLNRKKKSVFLEELRTLIYFDLSYSLALVHLIPSWLVWSAQKLIAYCMLLKCLSISIKWVWSQLPSVNSLNISHERLSDYVYASSLKVWCKEINWYTAWLYFRLKCKITNYCCHVIRHNLIAMLRTFIDVFMLQNNEYHIKVT